VTLLLFEVGLESDPQPSRSVLKLGSGFGRNAFALWLRLRVTKFAGATNLVSLLPMTATSIYLRQGPGRPGLPAGSRQDYLGCSSL